MYSQMKNFQVYNSTNFDKRAYAGEYYNEQEIEPFPGPLLVSSIAHLQPQATT